MDVYKMTEYRWKARIELEYLIKRTYRWFLQNKDLIKEVKIFNKVYYYLDRLETSLTEHYLKLRN
jgi:dTDP-D-glucose 4,6-dehydratase